MVPSVSLFASAVRPHLWDELLMSLKNNIYSYEVVFAGFIDNEITAPFKEKYPEFRYILMDDLKPAQCYEVARRNCTGELIGWIADDCRFSERFIDKVYDYWQSLNNVKAVISCKTNENGQNETMLNHRFFGRNQNTPLMAPIGIMSRDYLNNIGGFDKRFLCGQYENQCVMMVYSDGGKVHLYEDVCVEIDHKNKHGSTTNFWSGYNEDREQLENSWVIGGYQPNPKPILVIEGVKPPYWYHPINNTEVTLKRNDKHEPYKDMDILTKTQGPCGRWMGNGDFDE